MRRSNVSITSTILLAVLPVFASGQRMPAGETVAGADVRYSAHRLLVKLEESRFSAGQDTPELPGIASMQFLMPSPQDVALERAEIQDVGFEPVMSRSSNWYLAELEADADLDDTIEQLTNLPHVLMAEPDYLLALPDSVPLRKIRSGDPYVDYQYALDLIELPSAWQIQPGTPSVVVAVIDSGVQLNHPDLMECLWVNSTEIENGIDDDGNGYVDDIYGWNFAFGHSAPVDYMGHGTHVAGIIGATSGNNLGIEGAANVTVMPLQVFDHTLEKPQAYASDLIDAIHYAVNNGADVINLSLAVDTYVVSLDDACTWALAHDVVVTAAAGNYSLPQVSFPAGYDSVIAVGALDHSGQRAPLSHYGSALDLMAPGVEVLSTYLNSDYHYMTGTSMASPYVAAVAALMRSENPGLSASEIRERLLKSADDLGTPGWDQYNGYGSVNAYGALLAARQPSNGASGNDPETPPVVGPVPVPAPCGATSMPLLGLTMLSLCGMCASGGRHRKGRAGMRTRVS